MNPAQFLLVDDDGDYKGWQEIWERHTPEGALTIRFCDLTEVSQLARNKSEDGDYAIAWCTDRATDALKAIDSYPGHIQAFFMDVNLGTHPLDSPVDIPEIEEAVSGLDGNVDGLRLALYARWRNPNAFVVAVTGCGSGDHMERVATANANQIDLWVEKTASATLYFSFRRAWDHARSLLLAVPPDQSIVGLADQRELVQRYTQPGLIEPILILGQTGTGKEVVAKEIHQRIQSRQQDQPPFVPLNCAAIPETILESELFGAVKGAYTGADRDRPGAFFSAGTGVLFLDEIGELPLACQAKMLRALETRTIQRVGDPKLIPVAARIVAATHRDLPDMVAKGSFREDLYYRISTLPITIPPLRSRKGDIPALVNLTLTECGEKLSRRFVMEEAAFGVLQSYAWPGNVRQLQKTLWRLCVLSGPVDGSAKVQKISATDVRKEIQEFEKQRLVAGLTTAPGTPLDPKAVFASWLQQRGDSRARLSSDLGIDKRRLNQVLALLGFREGKPGRKPRPVISGNA